ncbi:magnesium transporter [Mycetocola reblochoni]|nr:magnesium transporter [Mycetocola reblochoni]
MPSFTESIEVALDANDLGSARTQLSGLDVDALSEHLDHQSPRTRAVLFRLLPKARALDVFERFDTAVQSELIVELSDDDTASLFDRLPPDERVELIDELPAKVAKRIVQTVPSFSRGVTATMLGYPQDSVGRRMGPEYVHAFPDETVAQALDRVKRLGGQAEEIYTIPVTERSRTLAGLISLRALVLAPEGDPVSAHMIDPVSARVDDEAELAARRLLDEEEISALPIVDTEDRLVGMLGGDDAHRIVEAEDREDAARAGGAEPLSRPYLLTSVLGVARSRVVWLLVLAVSGVLTVNVLDIFQATLEQRVALSLFIPLLTGIGGNTGSQAATTVTRALAMDEAQVRDIGHVAFKEARTGLLLGAILGLLGFAVASIVFGLDMGLVIGITLIGVCTIAATVGGVMPLVAKTIRVDPAVFSTPFISTFCDATGLILYFMVAKLVLGI